MRMQQADKVAAVDLCRAIVDEDTREWTRVVDSVYQRFGGVEATMASLVAMVLGTMEGDRIAVRRRLLEIRHEWPKPDSPVRVSAPVDAQFEVG